MKTKKPLFTFSRKIDLFLINVACFLFAFAAIDYARHNSDFKMNAKGRIIFAVWDYGRIIGSVLLMWWMSKERFNNN